MQFLFTLSDPTTQVVLTLLIFAVTIIAFMASKVRSDIIALCCTAALLVTGIVSPKEALAGFSNSAVVMMIALCVVGGAVFQTGLARMISSKLLRLAGNNELRLYLLVMLVTAVVAAFVSNTGTVALLLPIILAMCKTANINPAKLMMPLAFASSLGGVLTLIGTPPNLIVSNYLAKEGKPEFAFFEFLPIGLVCLVVGTVLLYPLCKFFLAKKGGEGMEKGEERTLAGLLTEYHIQDLVFRLKKTGPHSLLEGRSVIDLDIHRRFGVTILEIRREGKGVFGNQQQITITPETKFEANDIIYVLGDPDKVSIFAQCHELGILKEENNDEHAKLDFYDIGLAETLITPESALINRPLRTANFVERYGLKVLAIKRNGRYIFDNFLDDLIKPGDMLLMHGPWKGINSLAKKTREWLVIGRPEKMAESVAIDYKAPLAAIIMVIMVLMMVFEKQIGIPAVATAIIAGLIMVVSGCTRSVDGAYKMIAWEGIVLIAAMMPMSTALQNTGISKWVAENLVVGLQSWGPIAVLGGVYLVTSLLSTFISNSATALLVAPIAWAVAEQLGVHPQPFMMTAAVAASLCFATPICTPPNAMVMNAGHYTFSDYVKVGLPLQLILGAVAIFTITLLFPL